MKKLIYISLIAFMFLGTQVNADIIREREFFGTDTLEGIEDEFEETGTISPKSLDDIYSAGAKSNMFADYASVSSGSVGPRKLRAMPVFKKYRIKIQNYFKIKAHEQELKEEQQYKEELEKEMKLQEQQLQEELDP